MGSLDRSKKKVQLWKKAIFHFSLCFVMGFFTGFASTSKAPFLFTLSPSPKSQQDEAHDHDHDHDHQLLSNNTYNISPRAGQSPMPVPAPVAEEGDGALTKLTTVRKMEEGDHDDNNDDELKKAGGRRLIIIVSRITSKRNGREGVFLRRLSNSLRLVDPPLLWIVVEGRLQVKSEHRNGDDDDDGDDQVSKIVRKTGIMYRHLLSKQNFSNPEDELNHLTNLALTHIEHHRLSGILHFASLFNTYDLQFFHHLRDIEVFGTWAMTSVSANKQKVKIEGPVCESSQSQVIGWHLSNQTSSTTLHNYNIHFSNFAFNTSILWDPERWGRPSSAQRTKLQNSIKYVKEIIVEDEGKLKGIPPPDCSKIMLWHFHFPALTTTPTS